MPSPESTVEERRVFWSVVSFLVVLNVVSVGKIVREFVFSPGSRLRKYFVSRYQAALVVALAGSCWS
jgi:hypothetical protein